MARNSPLEAVLLGAASGIIGGAVMNRFFKASVRIRPPNPKGAFVPPEPEQISEMATATVARRFVEGLMKRGPLNAEQKQLGGAWVHYSFSAFWGVILGVALGSLHEESKWTRSSAISIPLFSLMVWEVGDNLILPGFKLGGAPERYPAKNHAYAILAHLIYGGVAVGTYEVLDRTLLDLNEWKSIWGRLKGQTWGAPEKLGEVTRGAPLGTEAA